jgi:chaperonin cofactor prefoldin
MGYRWRNMYYATGLPGWMRFGHSPGWVGRSPTGMPPGAEWIMSSGQMPQYQEYLQSRMTAAPPTALVPPSGATLTKEQEKQMLEHQVSTIESQLEATRKRMEELRKSPSTSQPQQTPPYYPSPYGMSTPEDELASLEDYKRNLNDEIKGVESRIEELKKLFERKTSK